MFSSMGLSGDNIFIFERELLEMIYFKHSGSAFIMVRHFVLWRIRADNCVSSVNGTQ